MNGKEYQEAVAQFSPSKEDHPFLTDGEVREYTLMISQLEAIAKRADVLKKRIYNSGRTATGGKMWEGSQGIHSNLGIISELSEVITAQGYRKRIDETGDVLWYLNLGLVDGNFSLDDAMVANVTKLTKRYGAKYSHRAAREKVDKQ